MPITGLRLVSGGQTGADRAALEFALAHGIPHGGWCPAGRRAEDGVIESRYQLRETPDSNSEQRTEWNVRDSDGTVIFSMQPVLRGGTQLTLSFAETFHKPVLHLFPHGGPASPEKALRCFITENRLHTLNVAGPRASEEPGVGTFVREVLEKMWAGER